MADTFEIYPDYSELNRILSQMSNSLRKEKMNSIIMEVMSELKSLEETELRKTISAQGYSDIMKGFWGSKKRAVSPKAIYLGEAKNGYGAVLSIAASNADFRLKWFEHGTSLRKTNDGKNRGQIDGNNWFSDTIDRNMSRLQDHMVTLIKKEIEK